MPRVTHVKKAQQRYEMIKTGDTVTVNRKTKSGREVTARKSVPNKSKPYPPRKCDHCGEDIEIGTPYKWIAPRSGPYGGTKRYRHESCPTWHVWEYSSSLSAMIQAAQYDAQLSLSNAEDQNDLEQVRDDFAAAIRDLADQKTESADNIESGFGHETFQSEELREQASELEGWADEAESWQSPDEPDEDELDLDDDATDDDREQALQDKRDEWLEEARDTLQEVIDSSPF